MQRSTTQHIEVTKTVVAPPIESTALPGSLSYTKYNPKRISDVTDVFADYKKSANCTISSLELHGAFEPLCKTKDSLLEAMSTGGRLGFDAPFSPRGCDMRWYSNDEICGILTKFEKIFILGDSMMRNVAVALSIIQRKDLVNGGRTTWASAGEGVDCRCAGPFETSKCAFYSTVSSRVIYREDPQSMYCNKKGRGGFECEYPRPYIQGKSRLLTRDHRRRMAPIPHQTRRHGQIRREPQRRQATQTLRLRHGPRSLERPRDRQDLRVDRPSHPRHHRRSTVPQSAERFFPTSVPGTQRGRYSQARDLHRKAGEFGSDEIRACAQAVL